MSEQPLNAGALRGAVDLSGLQSRPGPGRGPGGPGGESGQAGPQGAESAQSGSGLVVEGTDANFSAVVTASVSVPAVVVLWSARLEESRAFVETVVGLARSYGGRFQVVSVEVDANPGLLRAFQIQSVPVTLGLIQGQPVPLFAGIQAEEQIRPVIDELLALAVQHGVTGRVAVTGEGADGPGGGADEEQEPPLPPLHQEAFDAIERGDLEAAAAAYRTALKENPRDGEAEVGLAQVGLMQRTAGVDLDAARVAAAERPDDLAAQTLMADLDVLGGHVEDAFGRLVELVRRTGGEDRDAVRTHLLELFSVVGSQDERVARARRALMSALF